MQISAEKTQLMTNNTNGISTDITIDNKKRETVRSFKNLGAIVSDEGSKPEVLSRITQTTAAMTKLKFIWKDKNIAISSKIRLVHSLAMSIFVTCSHEMIDKSRHAVPRFSLKTVVGVNLGEIEISDYVIVHSFLHLIRAPFCCIRPINALNSVNDRHTGRFDTEK